MAWKLKYRCKVCVYETEVYDGRGLFRQQITPMSCPDCKTIQLHHNGCKGTYFFCKLDHLS